jgi:hypothetical protein
MYYERFGVPIRSLSWDTYIFASQFILAYFFFRAHDLVIFTYAFLLAVTFYDLPFIIRLKLEKVEIICSNIGRTACTMNTKGWKKSSKSHYIIRGRVENGRHFIIHFVRKQWILPRDAWQRYYNTKINKERYEHFAFLPQPTIGKGQSRSIISTAGGWDWPYRFSRIVWSHGTGTTISLDRNGNKLM